MLKNTYNYNTQTGMFRNKILLRQRVSTEDEIGQQIEAFEDYGYFWAMVKTSKNKEVYSSDQEITQHDKRYVLKYSKKLDDFIIAEKTSFELVHNGITYDVKEAIDDNDLHKTVTVYCEGRV